MKFLCPSCKAKYQVADEKVAGRSVRMKCRRCEFVISLSDAPPAPLTLAPSDSELVPRLPGPPSLPDLGSVPPWSPGSPARATPSVRPAALRGASPAVRGSAALAVVPARDELPVQGEQWFIELKGAPVGPITLSELRERAGSGEITVQTLVWREGDDGWKPLSSVPELVAIVEERLSRVRAAASPKNEAALPTPPPLPVAAHAGASPPPSVDHAAHDLAAAGLARPRLPITAWIALGVAMILGLTVGFVVFGEQKQPARAVQAGTTTTTVAGANASTSTDQAAQLPTVEASPAPGSSSKQAPAGRLGSAPAAKAAGKAESPPNESAAGLAAAPGGPSGESAPSGSLTSATIESTVARYKASVKRSCWQPALEARGDGAPTSARVNIAFTIAPSGAVQGVTPSADPPGYPGLGSCIAGRVRGWQFPPSGEATPVNVPFVFAGQ